MRRTLPGLAHGLTLVLALGFSLGFSLVLAAGAARAVIILDATWQEEGGVPGDEPEGFAAHVALAYQAPFRPLVAFSKDDGEEWNDCSGTWIGNFEGVGWVLTAAHCFRPGDGADVFLYRSEGETVLEGTGVWRHPRYNGDQDNRGGYDVALVRLDGPVHDAGPPPALWAGEIAVGQRIVFVGFGNRGLGSIGERSEFDVPADNKTAGENTIDEVAAPTRADQPEEDSGNWMRVTLRRPEEGAGRLDALLGSGDSGGSAWIERGGRWYLAGVNTSGTGETYGEQSYFLRLAGIRPWLSGLLPGLRFSQ